MSKYFKPVFDYKLSFDPKKGEKHSINVHYSVPIDSEEHVGAAISDARPVRAAAAEAAEARAPAEITHKVGTKSAEVRVCKTIAMDEVLSTLEKFERA